ncbi:hypothetical protein ACTQX5_02680 [Faecalicoccus sp. LCP19S3_E3]|uniref:hypothetical protein n=1 Tax=unclassified Faecalicoccus TaxID=2643311 RepID=UPI003F8F7A79
MKVIGTLASNKTDTQGSISFYFDPYTSGQRNLIKLQKLEEGEEYLITIESKKAVRTHRQNSYLWALIGEMCRNPNAPRHDEWELYCWLLHEANVSSNVLLIREDALDFAKRNFRAVDTLQYRHEKKGTYIVARCFDGTSKFTTKEMSALIDKTLEIAEELGIDTTLYKEVLQ